MTTWPARLSRDGQRILCGWTNVNGRHGCNGEIALNAPDGEVEFQPFYRQARPYDPNTEPLPLKIDKRAHEKWAVARPLT